MRNGTKYLAQISNGTFALLFVAFLNAPIANAQDKKPVGMPLNRLIIRVSPGNEKQGGLSARGLVGAPSTRANLNSFRQELRQDFPDLKSRSLPNVGVLVVEAEDLESLKSYAASSGSVAHVEVDREWKVNDVSDDAPSSTVRAPWLRDILGFTNPRVDDGVNPGSNNTVVAIVDTGARLDHPYLYSAWDYNMNEYGGAHQIDDDLNGYIDDEIGANAVNRTGDVSEVGTDHGTHVAGIVKTIRDQAIPQNPEAANVTLLPIRFIDDRGFGTTSGAIAALEYAAQRGAKVINCSWGALGSDAFSQALYDSMVYLYERDIVVVAAAGNTVSGPVNNNDETPYFPASYNIPSLLSVASVTTFYMGSSLVDYDMSYFSNIGGNTVHIAAPGSLKSDTENGIVSANAQFSSSSNLWKSKKGTSMAAPVVAGVAGVVRAINPGLSAYETKTLILNSASKVLPTNEVGQGRLVNAKAAFDQARAVVPKGYKPAVSSRAVAGFAAGAFGSNEDEQRGGGCGSISDLGPGQGNGLLGLLVVYLFYALFKNFINRRRYIFGI